MCQRVFGSIPRLSTHKMTVAHTSCDTTVVSGFTKSPTRDNTHLSLFSSLPLLSSFFPSQLPRGEKLLFSPHSPLSSLLHQRSIARGTKRSWTQNPEAMRQTKFPFITSASSCILSPWHKMPQLTAPLPGTWIFLQKPGIFFHDSSSVESVVFLTQSCLLTTTPISTVFRNLSSPVVT